MERWSDHHYNYVVIQPVLLGTNAALFDASAEDGVLYYSACRRVCE